MKTNLMTVLTLLLLSGHCMLAQKTVLDSINYESNGPKITYKYNEYGSVTERLEYEWNADSTGIVLTRQEVNVYDDANNLLEQSTFFLHRKTQKILPGYRDEYDYDTNNRLIKKTTHRRRNGVLTPESITEIDFIDDKTEVETHSRYVDDKWHFGNKYIITKTDVGETHVMYNSIDGTDANWKPYSKYLYVTNNSETTCYGYEIAEGTKDKWVESSLSKQTYNDAKKLTEEVKSEYDSKLSLFVPEEKIEIKYNNFGEELTKITYTNLASTTPDWYHTYEDIYTYDNNGFKIGSVSYLHLFTENQMTSKFTYDNDEYGNVLALYSYQPQSTEEATIEPFEKNVYTYIKMKDGVSDLIHTKTIYKMENGDWVQEGAVATYSYSSIDSPTAIEQPVSEPVVFKLFPNPAHNVINIQRTNVTDGNPCMVTVYNSLGAICYQIESTADSEEINISSFVSGLYIVKIGEHCVRLIKE